MHKKASISVLTLLITVLLYPVSLFALQQPSHTGTKQQSDGWRPLFNGKDLKGWKQVNGTAPYKVVDGAIVGTTVPNSPNSFLATDRPYGDFILELEFMMHPDINSGIQFRSITDPSIMDGRVHGYQFELDPSERNWTGGIYDEARRMWLYPLSLNEGAKAALKRGEWNKARIEAIGSDIRTWVNGVPVAHLIDDLTPSGIIALQVHSINKPEDAGKEIKWRNIRIKTENLNHQPRHDAFVVNLLPNKLSKKEQEQGWVQLWDGKTTQGWRGAHKEAFPTGGWEIKDGELRVLESGGGESVNGGDIVTEKEYAAFDFQFDFKLTEGANSGIKYFVTENEKVSKRSAIGLEYQILDDARHPDAKMGRDGNRTLASLYDLITAQKQERFLKPIGEWNRGRIVVHPNNKVEHWLNGVKVLEYERGSAHFRELVANSKYKEWPNFGEAASGHILLQDHGNAVAFRNIKIKELK